jgi:uncharacterized 2Fe-2S/4Fe-4S cluster protein (DUF4445 family)
LSPEAPVSEECLVTKKVTIRFEPEGRKVLAKPGTTVFEASERAGVGIRSECGGKHSCGKCRVIIEDQSNMTEVSEYETKLLTPEELGHGYRLACSSAAVEGDLTVFIPPETRMGKPRIQVEGMERPVKLDPAIKRVHLLLSRPTLHDITNDYERLLDAMLHKGFSQLEMDHELLRNLPDSLRNAGWDITVTVWNNKRIISIDEGNSEDINYGFSVDIGTSKIVGYLVDLVSGNVVSIQSLENPQMVYGEDIISRINYALTDGEALKKLQGTVVEAINSLIHNACHEVGANPGNVFEITVVGNTAMHHFFLGIQPKYLAVAPYVPAVTMPLDIKANFLNVTANPLANVHLLPVVAGFVGSDAVADVIATGICETHKMCLLIDIGTNGEVFVGNQEDIVSCSCAAGPAFEGMHIEHGMKARTGAIERVRLDPDTYEVNYETIGGSKPLGICGSGIVDAIAEMLKCGITSQRGGINRDIETKRLIKVNNDARFVIAWKHETGTGRDVTVSGKDIQEIQLAKAAIHTGAAILMNEKGLKDDQIDQVYIAGAFGRYINPENARFIGLIPDVPTERIDFVGNTAISGAKMVLISNQTRERAEKLSKQIRYVELMTAPDFRKEFRDSMFLPHRDATRYPTVMSHLRR